VDLSAKLNTVWASSGIGLMEELQKLIFPGGISYDRKAEKGGLPPRPGRPTSVIPDGGAKPKQCSALSHSRLFRLPPKRKMPP